MPHGLFNIIPLEGMEGVLLAHTPMPAGCIMDMVERFLDHVSGDLLYRWQDKMGGG